jgi:hypothetical protein
MYYIKQNQSINQQSKKLDDKPIEIFECQLVRTQCYVESFEIKPIALQKNVVELVIKTQLLSAKNPTEWRIKSRTCVEADSLKELQKVISSYIKKQSSSTHELQ